MRFELLHVGKVFLFCTALLSLFSSGVVVADEWSIEPSVSLNEEYNDNIRFTSAAHPGVLQSRLSPSVKLSNKTEVTEVSGSLQIGINQYSGDPLVKNTTDQLFSLLTRLQGERNTWVLNASYKQDSTAESERIATGIVQVRTQRSVLSLSPTWSRALSERSLVKVDYNYQDVKYDEHINLNDYVYQQVLAKLQYQLSELDQMSLTAGYSIVDYSPSIYQFPAAIRVPTGLPFPFPAFTNIPLGGVHTSEYKSSTSNIQVGDSHQFSETLRGGLSLGWNTSNTDVSHNCNGQLGQFYPIINSVSCSGLATDPLVTFNDTTKGNGYSLNVDLEKTLVTAQVRGFLVREIKPSGNGLLETDRFGVSLNKNLNENLTGSVDAVAYRTKYIGVNSPDSKYYTFEPKLNWRFTEWWTLGAGYRYARYESDGAANAITANAAYLNLTYNWPRMAISR